MTKLVKCTCQEVTRMAETTMIGHTVALHGGTSPTKRTPTRDNARKKKRRPNYVSSKSIIYIGSERLPEFRSLGVIDPSPD